MYGSVTNRIMERATVGQPEPTVGMGATLTSYTDRHAATIVSVETVGGRCRITVREDKANRTDKNGMSESQTYLYETDPNGAVHNFLRETNGRWTLVTFNDRTKRWNKADGGYGLRIGARDHYHDFSF